MFKVILVIFLIILNGCATPAPLYWALYLLDKTGSIYQASLSYGTGKIVNDMVSTEMSIVDRKN